MTFRIRTTLMRIGIVGGGISGLVAGYLLHTDHEITLFEAEKYVGGHTHTVDVEVEGERQAVDTGFIVYNDWTYPNFIKLLDRLGVATQPTSMGFSVRCDRSGIEYSGNTLSSLFAQRSNLFRWRFYRMIRDILRFNRQAQRVLETAAADLSVGDYLTSERYGVEFREQYFLPMASAIWSCPPGDLLGFPMRFIVEFYRNHGLLSVVNRPTWRVIQGGSRNYVGPLTRGFHERIRIGCPVAKVVRADDGVTITTATGDERFDEVILACHSDQAQRMLADASPVEEELLSAFRYQANAVVLHTDPSVLPRRRAAWASWNYHLAPGETSAATVTYNMNILQRLRTRHVFNVTLNETSRIDPRRILDTFEYSHPVFTTRKRAAQLRHGELIRHRRTSYCGAYWGSGFHEDGVNSALAVCRTFGKEL